MSHLLCALFPIGVPCWENPKGRFWVGLMVNHSPCCHWMWWVPGTTCGPHIYTLGERLLAIRSTLALSTSHLLQSASLAACPMIFPLKILFLISSGFTHMFEIQCSSARFGNAYTESGMIQRRSAWPLHKGDTEIREALKYCVLNFLGLVRKLRKYTGRTVYPPPWNYPNEEEELQWVVNETGTSCSKARVLILTLLLTCCVTLGKALTLSGLGVLNFSVKSLSGSSSSGILRVLNLGNWIEIPFLSKYTCVEIC